MVAAQKVLRWHKMPFKQFVIHESKRPLFQPFLIGGAISFVVCGILPTRGASQEDKEKSKYWQRENGTFNHGGH